LPPQAAIDADRQLALYQLGIKQKWPWTENSGWSGTYVAFDRGSETFIQDARAARSTEKPVAWLIDKMESDREFSLRKAPSAGGVPTGPIAL